MITIEIAETGDRAEAEDEVAAVFAARVLGREALDSISLVGFQPTVVFSVAGAIVRTIEWRSLLR